VIFTNRIFGYCLTLKLIDGYSIYSRNKIDLDQLEKSSDFVKLFEIAEVRSISSSNSLLRAEYFTILGTNSISEFISIVLKTS